MSTVLISHSACALHDVGSYHPECPERLAAINEYLSAAGLDSQMARCEAPEATREQLARVHHVDYIDEVHARAPVHGLV
ncbi:MAG: histone deacetylase family protein, partial [Pseudomonadota bacterium]|nr:histone deacetylase family protein [Pseudomonadota bacterium]